MNNELLKKADLHDFRSEIRIKFTEVDTRFAEIKGQFELLKWILGFMLAGTVAILFKIFH